MTAARTLPPNFEAWYADRAALQARACAIKAQAYGSDDLYDMGRELVEAMGEGTDDPQVQYEAAVYFYLRGKLARMFSAIKRGALPSDDTLEDIVIYAMLALHERERNRPFDDGDDLG